MRNGLIGVGLALLVCGAGDGKAAQDNYGAIAASPDGSYGYSYDSASQAEAEQAALNRCGAWDCVVKVWFRNTCGAYARGRGGEGWAWGDTREEAEDRALRGCSARGRDCEVVCWVCNSR